jgi:hypothetical protein
MSDSGCIGLDLLGSIKSNRTTPNCCCTTQGTITSAATGDSAGIFVLTLCQCEYNLI